MTACGIVSRVTPVHTAVRNCTGDEGGPFEVGFHSGTRKQADAILGSRSSRRQQGAGARLIVVLLGFLPM